MSFIPPLAAEADRLGHVLLLDLIHPFQIGDGAGHSPDTVSPAGGQDPVADGHGNQSAGSLRLATVTENEMAIDLPSSQLRIVGPLDAGGDGRRSPRRLAPSTRLP